MHRPQVEFDLSFSGAAIFFPVFLRFLPPSPLCCVFGLSLVFLWSVCSLCVCCWLGGFVCCCSFLCLFGMGSRTRTGAMDWTALQRVALALTRGALCFTVQSAREQQSLQAWFVLCGCSGTLQTGHSVGECHMVLLILLRVRPLQHLLQIAQGR